MWPSEAAIKYTKFIFSKVCSRESGSVTHAKVFFPQTSQDQVARLKILHSMVQLFIVTNFSSTPFEKAMPRMKGRLGRTVMVYLKKTLLL
jgi:hypothetical protein